MTRVGIGCSWVVVRYIHYTLELIFAVDLAKNIRNRFRVERDTRASTQLSQRAQCGDSKYECEDFQFARHEIQLCLSVSSLEKPFVVVSLLERISHLLQVSVAVHGSWVTFHTSWSVFPCLLGHTFHTSWSACHTSWVTCLGSIPLGCSIPLGARTPRGMPCTPRGI